MDSRVCTGCGERKPLSEFYRWKRGREGRRAECKVCSTLAVLSSKRKNPKRAICSVMLNDARKRSAKRGYGDLNITTNYLLSIASDNCPVLEIPLRWEYGHGKGVSDRSPSLDRIDNSKGYVVGNVAIISIRANTLKRDASLSEIKALASYMEKAQGLEEK